MASTIIPAEPDPRGSSSGGATRLGDETGNEPPVSTPPVSPPLTCGSGVGLAARRGQHAAIDHHGGATQVRGSFGAEKGHHVTELVRGTITAKRDPID